VVDRDDRVTANGSGFSACGVRIGATFGPVKGIDRPAGSDVLM
jgi:hypothetical protein